MLFRSTQLLSQFLAQLNEQHRPYFGQCIWFKMHHPEKVPSAQERYDNEVRRLLGVLESVLSKQEWLVGGKFTIADLAFVPYVLYLINFVSILTQCTPHRWNSFLSLLLGDDFDFAKEFPAVHA